MIPRDFTRFLAEALGLIVLRKITGPAMGNGTSKPYNASATRIREARIGHHTELQYNLPEAAHRLGIPADDLARIEAGEVLPCDALLKKMEAVYGYTAVWLASGVPPKRNQAIIRKTVAMSR